MIIGFVSDLHITSKKPHARTDDPVKTGAHKLSRVLRECDVLLQAGDFTNTARDFILLFNLIKLLKKRRTPIYLVRGQHDSYQRTNLASIVEILRSLKLVKYLSSTPTSIGNCRLYGVDYGEKKIPKPKKKSGEFNILVIHKYITPVSLYPNDNPTDPKTFLKKYSEHYDYILVGDPHVSFFFSNKNGTIFCTGPMFRRSIDEKNLSPHMFTINDEEGILPSLSKKSIVHSNKIWDVEAIEQEKHLNNLVETFSNNIIRRKTSIVDSVLLLEELMKDADGPTRREVKRLRREYESHRTST